MLFLIATALILWTDDHVKEIEVVGDFKDKLEAAWVEDVKKPTKRTMQDVVAKFSSNEQRYCYWRCLFC